MGSDPCALSPSRTESWRLPFDIASERSGAKSLGEAPSSYLSDQKTAAHPFPTEQTVEAWKTPAASGDTGIFSPCHGLEALHEPAITIEP